MQGACSCRAHAACTDMTEVMSGDPRPRPGGAAEAEQGWPQAAVLLRRLRSRGSRGAGHEKKEGAPQRPREGARVASMVASSPAMVCPPGRAKFTAVSALVVALACSCPLQLAAAESDAGGPESTSDLAWIEAHTVETLAALAPGRGHSFAAAADPRRPGGYARAAARDLAAVVEHAGGALAGHPLAAAVEQAEVLLRAPGAGGCDRGDEAACTLDRTCEVNRCPRYTYTRERNASDQVSVLKTDDEPATLIDHPIEGHAAPIYLDGSDWTATRISGAAGPEPILENYSSWPGLLPFNRTNSTGSYVTDSVVGCGKFCDSQGAACVGVSAFRTQVGGGDPVLATQCRTYGSVPSLISDSTQLIGLVYYAKRQLPVPPHPPIPPPLPPLPSTINATVPGDVITDLQRAGILGDPYYNTNWAEPRFVEAWNSGTWRYSKKFKTPPAAVHDIGSGGGGVLLVLDGIRMGSMIFVNGVLLGNTSNAYRRYTFTLDSSALRHGDDGNELAIHFGADLGISADGRYTHAQQIDWAPVQPTTDKQSAQRPPWGPRATFGFAIWKSVYLVPLEGRAEAVITHLVPHTFFAGGHPTSLLTTSSHAGFEVVSGVELYCPGDEPCKGAVSLAGSWPNSKPVASGPVTVPAREYLTVNLTVPHTETIGVQLWHPRGNGGQPRYKVTATYTSQMSTTATASRMIGFRHIALVTTNDTDPTVRMKQNGTTNTGAFTMLFRVNGAAVYARGGAKVPMDLFEGRFTAAGHRRLVQSAAEGNFNLIRLWGGSIYEPRAFYDAADAYGVLLYHDLQYNRDEGDLGNTSDQRDEIGHQVRRLSHHPAIAVWNGGNEMYAPLQPDLDVILTQLALHDKSRPIWPASPGSGWLSGVDPLSSRPCGARNPGAGTGEAVLCGNAFPLKAIGNGNGDLPPGVPMARPPGQPYPFEYHGPYYDGSTPTTNVMATGWPAREVNAGTDGPGSQPVSTGTSSPGFFIAEFGCTVWPSFESLSATLSEDNWGYPSPATGSRNHRLFSNLFPACAVNATHTGEKAFKSLLYRSMINQMLVMKVLIEGLRSQNAWGTSFVSPQASFHTVPSIVQFLL